MASLFSELKQRNGFRVGFACIVVAWLIVCDAPMEIPFACKRPFD
jgi:hypothetical protein